MIDRKYLNSSFDLANFPEFSCPRCNSGILAPVKKLKYRHPKFSQLTQKEAWSDAEMVEIRIASTLVCTSPVCGEFVSYYAKGCVHNAYLDDGDSGYEESYKTKSIYPSPWIISIPNETPNNIRQALFSSFNAIWFSQSLCANALRQCFEYLLDYQDVPRKIGRKRQSLFNRIKSFEKDYPDHAEFFEVVRNFLNAGSHGNDVSTETLLDVFEALEIYLVQLFDNKQKRFEELKSSLKTQNF